MFLGIDNTPRDYAWGAHDLIADFRGRTPTPAPEAELWLGAHPGCPARIPVLNTDLAAWIDAEPARALGSRYAACARLPFLLKLLAADAPLSLQAHPTLAQAQAGFAREEALGLPAAERNYLDPWPKPEIIVAISERFEALSGFRPLAEARAVITALADAADAPDAALLMAYSDRLTDADALRRVVAWLLARDPAERSGVAALTDAAPRAAAALLAGATLDPATAPSAAAPLSAIVRASALTVVDLAKRYPGDAGIVLSLLLNRVTLRRGEALYLAAGNIHAYLGGLGIELMTASDNVLRGGLTPKRIDVPELLAVLDTTPRVPPHLPVRDDRPGVSEYRPDGPDFTLFRVTEGMVMLPGPAIVLAEGDTVQVRGEAPAPALASGNPTVTLLRGEACYVTPDERALTVSGPGIAWIATTQHPEG